MAPRHWTLSPISGSFTGKATDPVSAAMSAMCSRTTSAQAALCAVDPHFRGAKGTECSSPDRSILIVYCHPARSMTGVELQLSARAERQDALAYALVFVDLLAISVWVAGGWVTVFDSGRAYWALGGVMILLGCLGFVLLRQVSERDDRHRLLVFLGLPSALVLLLPPGSLMLTLGKADAFRGF